MLVELSHSMCIIIENALDDVSRTLELCTEDKNELKLAAQADIIKGYLQTCRENDD